MCGISGKICVGGGYVKQSELEAMAGKICYRGPDDSGYFISPNRKVGFGHNRLAIIDLSSAGHQPMSYLNRYWITFNGEVYNFPEEKEKLIKLGYRFKSGTDTEVVLALYDKYGFDCLKHMRGMFALAIYDLKQNLVFIARDRLGKKPLKYFFDGKVFYFASELKAFLDRPEIKKKPDWVSLHHYLTFGYVPEHQTGFAGIRKLEPAHYMVIDLISHAVAKYKYWELDFSQKMKLSQEEWCRIILKELNEAVKIRMIADVPIGAFLSGGVDSSGIVALMAQNSTEPVRTFTITFKEKSHNEAQYAANIARRYHTEHTEIPTEIEDIEILPELVKHFESPFSDSSIIITYLVSQAARKYVTVVLNGDGGDENFAGYPRYLRVNRDVTLNNISWMYPPLRLTADILNGLTDWHLAQRASKFLHKADMSLARRYATYNCYFTNEEKQTLCGSYFQSKIHGEDSYAIVEKYYAACGKCGLRDKALYTDISTYLSQHLLTKVDLASMKVSLEGRSPYTDHKFVEMAAKIPFGMKIRNFGGEKYILKKALEPLVPRENLYREKIGFAPPLGDWFAGKLNSYTRSKLLAPNSFSAKLFRKTAIRQLLEEHNATKDRGMQLWNLLALELWFEAYFR
jgi:asparagine synthase (glutamine-hydrolysing)